MISLVVQLLVAVGVLIWLGWLRTADFNAPLHWRSMPVLWLPARRLHRFFSAKLGRGWIQVAGVREVRLSRVAPYYGTVTVRPKLLRDVPTSVDQYVGHVTTGIALPGDDEVPGITRIRVSIGTRALTNRRHAYGNSLVWRNKPFSKKMSYRRLLSCLSR